MCERETSLLHFAHAKEEVESNEGSGEGGGRRDTTKKTLRGESEIMSIFDRRRGGGGEERLFSWKGGGGFQWEQRRRKEKVSVAHF